MDFHKVLFFSLYFSVFELLPATRSRKFVYADDWYLAIRPKIIKCTEVAFSNDYSYTTNIQYISESSWTEPKNLENISLKAAETLW